MARICKKCGERLFPTDTFCGFCGEPVDDININLNGLGDGPRPLVGDDALTSEERARIDNLKAKIIAGSSQADAGRQANRMTRQESSKRKLSAREMEEKRAKIIAAKQAAAERLEAERLEAERLEAERLEAERLEAERLEAERLEAERLEAERLEAERLEAERLEAERLEAERLEAERLEAERLEAERLEAERLEAERLEAERLEAERLEAERLEAERLEAERLETERLEAERLEQLRTERLAAEEEAARLAAEAERLEEEARLLAASGESAQETDSDDLLQADEANESAHPAVATMDDEISELYSDDNNEDEAEEISWEAADRRANEEQQKENRLIRKKRINDGPDNTTRDIVILSIGIVILIVILVFLLKDEIGNLKGNDSDRIATPTEATATIGIAMQTDTVIEPDEEYVLSDAGTAWDGSIAEMFIQGTGEESSPYLLTTGSELAYLAEEVNRGVDFEGCYFELANDIDLSGLEWTPIGYYQQSEDGTDMVYSFNGSFNGNGYKIANLTISTLENAKQSESYSDNNVCGLFGTVYGASISDLNIENGSIDMSKDGSGAIAAGLLVGCSYNSVFTNCQVNGALTLSSDDKICAGLVVGQSYDSNMSSITASGAVKVESGAAFADAAILCGYAKGGSLSEITVDGGVIANGSGNIYTGGAVGYGNKLTATGIDGEVTLTTATTGESAYVMTGGAFGYYINGNDKNLNISSTIDADGIIYLYAGGIYGYADTTTSGSITAVADINAAVTGAASYMNAGGAAGGFNLGTLTDLSISGKITSEGTGINYTGGIIGNSTECALLSSESAVELNVLVKDSDTGIAMGGGICGSNTDGTVTSVTSTGSVTVNSSYDGYAGGAFGYIKGGSYESVTASGEIKNTASSGVSSGGIAGYQAGEVTISDCKGSTTRTNDGKNVYDDDISAIIQEN